MGRGYLELMAGASTQGGAFARAESGFRVSENAALFGFGQADRSGAMAGIGARLEFSR